MFEYLDRILKSFSEGEVNYDDVNYVRDNLDDLDKDTLRKFINCMLLQDDIKKALKVLEKSGILFRAFPELEELIDLKQPSKYHNHDVFNHVMSATCYSEKDLVLRLTMLLHDIGKKETFHMDETGKITFYGHGIKGATKAYKMLSRLGYDKKIIEEVCLYIRHHMDYAPTEKSFNKMLKEFGNDLEKVDKFLKVKLYDKYGCKGKDDEIATFAREEIQKFRAFLDKYKR